MGISGLYQEVIERPEFDLIDDAPTQNISELRGKSIAIDASILIYHFLFHANSARRFHASPKVPVRHVVKKIISWHKNHITANGIVAIWVFDGLRHPMKKRTDDKRAKLREADEQKLLKLYQSEQESDASDVMSLWKRLVYPRGDIIHDLAKAFDKNDIAYLQAPFEGEAQCVALQLQGHVDYTLSEDGDTYALGSPA